MNLSDMLSSASISALQTVAKQAPKQNKSASNLATKVVSDLVDFAYANGCKYSNREWDELTDAIANGEEVIVCIDGKRIDVLTVRHEVIFAKHIGALLKQGNALCWVDLFATEITWKNWKAYYAKMTAKRDPRYDELPDQITRTELIRHMVNAKRERLFAEGARVVRKHHVTRACNLSFEAMRAVAREQELQTEFNRNVRGAQKLYELVCA